MIIEARNDVVALEGSLDKNLWPTIQAAANLLLRQHTHGIIIDGSMLTGCSPEGAKTFRDAMDYIERYRARIVVAQLPDTVMEVLRGVPGVRSRLPISGTIEEARASLSLARANTGQNLETGGRALQDILVPLLRADSPETATLLACRLAKADGQKTRIHLAYFLEVPRHLPISAPLPAEEHMASVALQAAEKRVKHEGLTVVTHIARTRDVGEGIIQQAGTVHANMIVLSIDAEAVDDRMREIARAVLDRAPCEVILNKVASTG